MSKDKQLEQFYTLPEVANRLSIDRQTILRRISEGKIEAYKIGRFWRIPESAISGYLSNCRAEVIL